MMSDRYAQIVNAPIAASVAAQLGLPRPVGLDRYRSGEPLIGGSVLLGAAPGGHLGAALARTLASAAVKVATTPEKPLREAAAAAGLDATLFNPESGAERFKGLVFDASGIADSTELLELQRFFYPASARLERIGRVIVLGTPAAAERLHARRHRAAST